MKDKKLTKSIAALMVCSAMLTGVIQVGSLSASAASYKVYKDDVTVRWLDTEWNHEEFEKAWVSIYNAFGADVTIEMVKDYTQSPHSEEWIRSGGPYFFADCWFQLHWYQKNDMMNIEHKYCIGMGWHSKEGWR